MSDSGPQMGGASSTQASPPVRSQPRAGKPQYLWTRAKEALLSLPVHFSAPEIRIAGIRATEVFTLGAALGATIEDQVVTTLNRIRGAWDPEDNYPLVNFVRQPQTFPDVLLQNVSDRNVHLGIELKSWYLLSKEREPTFRFQVTPAACAVQDLIVVVPWFLSDVISGTPRVLRPYIESAQYAAKYRNYWWNHLRKSGGSREIRSPSDVTVYPQKTDQILDEAVNDKGNNFGRIARTGIMDEFVEAALNELIAGIPARSWRQFFSMFTEKVEAASIAGALQSMERGVKKESPNRALEHAKSILAHILDELRDAGD